MSVIRIFFFSCLMFLITNCNQKSQLVWEETFDGDVLNETNWNYELGDGCPELCGWGNNEKQKARKNLSMEELKREQNCL